MALEFHHSFTFRTSERSVAFYNADTVMFAAGKLCVLHNLNSGDQKCFQFADGAAEVSAIVRCGEVLMAAAIRGRPPCVCLFNILSDTRKFYSAPKAMYGEAFEYLSVSANIKFVAAQGGPPDWLLVVWLSQTREVLTTLCPVAGRRGSSVRDISFHAGGFDELVVVGNGVFRLYEYQEEEEMWEDGVPFEETVFKKFEEEAVYHTIAWPERENLAVGSSRGKVLFFRGIELVSELSPEDDLSRLFRQRYVALEDNNSVSSIVATSQRLFCVFAGCAVLVYEREEIPSYALTMLLTPPRDSPGSSTVPGESREEPDHLSYIVVGEDCRDLIATTRDGQMLRCSDFLDSPCQQFTTLLQRQHGGGIIGMDVARTRPLIASACRYVVNVWNYRLGTQELRKKFRNEIRSVAVHPTGLYLALGFDHCCRLFSVLHSDLRERSLIACRNCSRIGFPQGGHLTVVASGSSIEIYSFVTCALLSRLEGHAGLVTSFDWIDHSTKLVSCDDRGVVCEWNLRSFAKIWEVTATLSYRSVAANSLTGHVAAVATDRSIRCFDSKSSLLLWTRKCKEEATCAVYAPGGTSSLHLGTSEGCLELHSFPESDETEQLHAHSGRVTGLKHVFTKDFLISSGSDGCLFVWKKPSPEGNEYEFAPEVLSETCLVENSTLLEQKDREKQLRLSLRHADTACDCQYELSRVKHEEFIRNLALDHERTVDDLNEKIARIREDKQIVLFDPDPMEDVEEVESAVTREIVETTLRLNKVYEKSNAFADETDAIVLRYENEIDRLSEEHARRSCAESIAVEEIVREIGSLENALQAEREKSDRSRSTREDLGSEREREATEEAGRLRSSEEASLAKERSESERLRMEIARLQKLTELWELDTRRRRDAISGQADHDHREKMDVIAASQETCRRLECELESREETCRKQERKFRDLRKSVGMLRERRLVSDAAIEELLEEIGVQESGIESCRAAIEEATADVPRLEEEIRSTEDLCRSVTEKLLETVDGYRKKQRALRDIQQVVSRYASMLQSCIGREHDPVGLTEDIRNLFEEAVGYPTSDESDDLRQEFDYQIGRLKGCYDRIKGGPSKAMRDKSMAELRMAVENSKILDRVHEFQRDAEGLSLVIGEMETTLGTHQSADGEPMRDRIEFVVEASKRNREADVEEISRLDLFIEEQQREIERFQTMLAAKLKNQ